MKRFHRITTLICLVMAMIILSACDNVNVDITMNTSRNSSEHHNATTSHEAISSIYNIKALSYYNFPPEFTGDMSKLYNAVTKGQKVVELDANLTADNLHDLFYIIKYTAYSTPNFPTEYVLYTNGYNKVTKVEFTYTYSAAEGKKQEKELSDTVKKILSCIPEDATEYDKVKFIHDWIVVNCEYDKSASDSADDVPCFTAYGALVNQSAVCEGYSKAFSLLCQEAGIESFCIVGDAGGPHMWNMVKCENEWYCMDVTWDDPGTGKNMIGYGFFNLTDKEMSDTHTPQDNMYISIPSATSTDCNYYVRNNLIADSYVDAKTLISQQATDALKKGDSTITIKLANDKIYKDTLNGLFTRQDYYPIMNNAARKAGVNKKFYSVNYSADDKSFVIVIGI